MNCNYIKCDTGRWVHKYYELNQSSSVKKAI